MILAKAYIVTNAAINLWISTHLRVLGVRY